MKSKKIRVIVAIICIIILILSVCSNVVARITSTAAGSTQNFGIVHLHTSSYLNGSGNKTFGYKVDDRNVYRIYAGSNNSDGYINTVLCLDKYGKFPAEDSSTDRYTSLGQATQNVLTTIKTTKNGSKTNLTASDAQKIIWLMNNAILPEDSSQLKDVKLSKILSEVIASTSTTQNPLTVDYVKSILTDDDLVFALQATIWSITNPGQTPVYQGTANGTTYNALVGNDVINNRGKQGTYINLIINYYKNNYDGRNGNIVLSSKDGYVNPKLTKPSQKLEFTNGTVTSGYQQGTIDNDYIFVGPFKIESSVASRPTIDYSVEISFTDLAGRKYSGEKVQYYLKSGKTTASAKLAQTKAGLEGKEFYIALKKGTLIRKVDIKLNTASITSDSTPTAWSVIGNENMQPLISTERTETTPSPITDNFEFNVKFEREHDVALRKFITAVRRKDFLDNYTNILTTTRVPNQLKAPANSFNQYEYKHRKVPVEVEVGDIVEYKIRVYNEGKYNAQITNVIDYIPSGIEFLPNGWKDGKHTVNYSSNKCTITQSSNKIIMTPLQNQECIQNKTLHGTSTRTEEKLEFVELTLQFKVTEAARGRIVTNIAEVAGFTGQNDTDGDGNGDGDFIPQKDCDSEVFNVELPDGPWDDYIGNKDNKEDLTDSDYYYKGQEDDDDFEKIIIPAPEGKYNLQLIKIDNNTGTRIKDTEFKITFPDGTIQYGKTDLNGILTLDEVKIDSLENDTIIVEETKETPGYNKLSSKITLTVNKTQTKENNKTVYKVTSITARDDTGKSFTTRVNGTTAEITIPNDSIEGKYNINLAKVDSVNAETKLKDAEFKITLPDGSVQIKRTDDNGILSINDIKIKNLEKDTITIEETKAPNGYDRLIEKIILEVTKKEKSEGPKKIYQIDNIQITSGNDQNLVATNKEENTINVLVPNKKAEGTYKINLLKVDSVNKEIKLKDAIFKITLPDGTITQKTTDENGNILLDGIKITETGIDHITIEETKAPNGYDKLIEKLTVQINKEEKIENSKTIYHIGDVQITEGNNENITTINKEENTINIVIPNKKAESTYKINLSKVDSENSTIKLKDAIFRITLPDRTTQEKTTDENGNLEISGIKITEAGTEQIIIEEITAPSEYNKLVEKITLEITKIEKNEESKTTYEVSQVKVLNEDATKNITVNTSENTINIVIPNKKAEGKYNIHLVKVDSLNKEIKLKDSEFKITLPDGTTQEKITNENGDIVLDEIIIKEKGIDSITIEETKAPTGYTKLIGKLTIEITKEEKEEDNKKIYYASHARIINDSDEASITASLKDNTIEIIIPNSKDKEIEIYDLALKKFVSSVFDGTNTPKKIPNTQKRNLQITDVTKLKERKTGTQIADATYSFGLDKEMTPVKVEKGDYVTYTIRVYNEGLIDGKVGEIVDNIPEELTFLPDSIINKKYGWEKNENEVRTKYLQNTLLKAFDADPDKENESNYDQASGTGIDKGVSYAEVKIEFKVNDKAKDSVKIKNIAEITEDDNDDNDSTPDNKDPEEDDEDFDVIIPSRFDLALRKFITKIEDKPVTDRVPEVDTTNLDNRTSTTAKYKHPKQEDTKVVVTGQIVEYTIRVYNEGTEDGYASEIKDDIPEGLEFLPEHKTNIDNKWKMYDKDGNETQDTTKAVSIRTDAKSKENSKERKGDESNAYNKPDTNLIKAYNPDTMKDGPDYVEVKAAFKVIKESVTDGNNVIINTAEITKETDEKGDEVKDDDSTPDNDNPDEDDIDKEYLQLKYFDLSLLKYVTKVIVNENGVIKETNTGHTGLENPEPAAKVELNKDKLDKTTVTFVYTIKITNEGQIEGYAKEITDRIPDGLEFHEADNPGWKKVEDKIVTTENLANTLLKPGESTTTEIKLRWINNENNLGTKINTAEISKDENEYGIPDIDSTPGNNIDGEDDQDTAPVILTLVTGKPETYFILGIVVITIISTGIYTIKKYVL